MEHFSSTGQLVTLGLVDSSIGAMAKGLALPDVETLVAKDLLWTGHFYVLHWDTPLLRRCHGVHTMVFFCLFIALK